jgi:ABC-type lipoprotein release transport system permease subunit
MDSTIIIALISFTGTLIGTFGGIITSNKLTTYRIQQLENKVDKHNGFGERIPVIEEQVKVINHRLDDLEQYHKN